MRIHRQTKNKRRATILLMVVSLLALLFVIVTGYLSVSRTNLAISEEVQSEDSPDQLADNMVLEWATGLIKDQIVGSGGVLTGAPDTYAFEDIPGYRQSNYLASLEPVWDKGSILANEPNAPQDMDMDTLYQLRWPAVTSFDPGVKSPQRFALYELLRDFDPNDASFRLRRADVEWCARKPFMDADGDGMPDSHFLLSAPATEAANSMVDLPISLPRLGDGLKFNAFSLPDYDDANGTWQDEVWNAYDNNARYEVAVRIISHGGMATLDSPALPDPLNTNQRYTPFNRFFTVSLFDQIKAPGDAFMRVLYQVGGDDAAGKHTYNEQDRLFEELHAASSAIEVNLRRRFLLPSAPAFYDYTSHKAMQRVPTVLAELQGQTSSAEIFNDTFLPESLKSGDYAQKGEPRWQRFNLGDDDPSNYNEREAWSSAVAQDTYVYNQKAPTTNGQAPRIGYSRRHFITTVNNSDELARKQTPGQPRVDKLNALFDYDYTLNDGSASLYDGELKYYLGEVSKAFDPDVTPNPTRWTYNINKGQVIIEQLARFYFDMLASHSKESATSAFLEDWNDIRNGASASEVVDRRQQAIMLAVNTVAFAAPRCFGTGYGSADYGKIDTVTYYDAVDSLYYTGYAPQPFFTEVIFHNQTGEIEEDPYAPKLDPVESQKQPSVAIKLFNPHAPHYNGVNDEYALNMNSFGIRIKEDPSYTLYPLGDFGMLNGYEFMTAALKATGGGDDEYYFNKEDAPAAIDIEIPNVDLSAAGTYTFYLVRSGVTGRESIVDAITVDKPSDNGAWINSARDTSPARFYRGADIEPDGVVDFYPRWNLVTNTTISGNGVGEPGYATLAPAQRHTYLQGAGLMTDPDVLPSKAFAPTTPLITMNAAPYNDLALFGNAADPRPRSFPTVGFLLFLSRYAHVQDNDFSGSAAPANAWPIGETLYLQWDGRGYNTASAPVHPTEYPADFGHMPIFDNLQTVNSNSYLGKTSSTGNGLPWGLLVFDYFTTLDPARDRNDDGVPDVDPLRVPGRININAAPWHVLANIPLIGPDANLTQNITNADLPILQPTQGASAVDYPSPEFWDHDLGVLVGTGDDPFTPGFDEFILRHMAMEKRFTFSQNDNRPDNLPRKTDGTGLYRLGPWLAQAIASYRDGVQYIDGGDTTFAKVYADVHLRDGVGEYGVSASATSPLAYYRPQLTPITGLSLYGQIRGTSMYNYDVNIPDDPNEVGFLTIGELANVKGFDSADPNDLNTIALDKSSVPTGFLYTPLTRGDFVKAVSLLALMDSQYLTTRSNTFTIYSSIMDRDDPESSVRIQTTVDRSNLLPELEYATWDVANTQYMPADDPNHPRVPLVRDYKNNTTGDLTPDGIIDTPALTRHDDEDPRVIAEKKSGYFNAEFDD